MSSLTWSLGCPKQGSLASRSFSSNYFWQQLSSRRKSSCNCACPEIPIAQSLRPLTVARVSETLAESKSVRSIENFPSNSIRGESLQRLLPSVLSVVVAFVMTIGIQGAPTSRDTFEDVPQTLSGEDKGHRIQKPNSAKAEICTRKCVSTCIRGGAGAPGEGPLNVRRPLVVFKEGFRSRNYCLVECSEICNLIGEGDSGP